MITVEDFNSILLKYKYSNAFHEIDFSLINHFPVQYDFCNITRNGNNYTVEVVNSNWTGGYYFKANDGTVLATSAECNNRTISFSSSTRNFKLILHLSANPLALHRFIFRRINWKPITKNIMLFGEDFNKKFYMEFFGEKPQQMQLEERGNYMIITRAIVKEDENGYYIDLRKLSPFTDFDVYGTGDYDYIFYGAYKKYRDIPQVTVGAVYLGCKNTLKVYFDGIETELYEAYYKGDLLKDNVLDLSDDLTSTDVTLTIKIKDPKYYNTKVLDNVPCEIFKISDAEDLEIAIANKYSTISFESSFDIENKEFDYPLNIINSDISFSNCTFSDMLTLKDCTVALDNRDYIFSNLTLDGTSISKSNNVSGSFGYIRVLNKLKSNNCNYSEVFIHCGDEATFSSDNFNNSLIFSDGKVKVVDSVFNGSPMFNNSPNINYPNMLYLTGDYDVQNNQFNLTGMFYYLTFNICVIKTLNGFDSEGFLENNEYNGDIDVIGHGMHRTSFFYCLVDDDTIYSKQVI